MASPSDHAIVDEIRAGRREALGFLFDQYGSPLYEFIYRLIGDREQAAALLERAFLQVPSASDDLREQESVRGWLYRIARQAAFHYLQEKDWLGALPPSEKSDDSDLAADIWSAARVLPALYRAALVVDELHGLSPTEKARALGIPRTDVATIVEQARRALQDQFALQAGLEERVVPDMAEVEGAFGLRRRIGTAGSLFGYLPPVALDAATATDLRVRILGESKAFPSSGRRPIAVAATETTRPSPEEVAPAASPSLPLGCSIPVLIGALAVALVLMLAVTCIGFLVIRDTTRPSVIQVAPPDGATLAPNSHVVIAADFQDDRAVDVKSIQLSVDGRDVTSQALVSDRSVSYPVDLGPGQHFVVFQVSDTSGNQFSRTWQFTIQDTTTTPTPTVLPTSTLLPTLTATATPLPLPTNTPPALPVINFFTANQTVITPGAPVLLSWSVSNAAIVFLNQDKVNPTGTQVVGPTTTTTFHLIANNGAGTVEHAVTVTVQQLPDLIVVDISVNPVGQVVYSIQNVGAQDVVSPFLIQVFIDGIPVDTNHQVSSLPVGQTVSLYVANYTLVGTHRVTVRLNADRVLPELNLNNDELTRSLSGARPSPFPTVTRTSTVTPSNTPPPTATLTPSTTPASTLTPTPTRTSRPNVVSGVTVRVTPTSYSGTCPGNFAFSAAITTTGPLSVSYRWERSDGSLGQTTTINIPDTGPRTVTDRWQSAPTGNGWARVHILTPNDLSSTIASFTNNCH